ncbi:Aldehyde dehydrogenase, putative [Perkinsus marinus ATCC 50983]|uniref:Aldehyde dehydrogenase, putative n=1 Tax=Perkinsus marinus (strain ATCC 50983 / TXsc) TaxID=423536 RepID=C5LVR4_PERM5|nr:Aldehyde dehydrogenase, putative [Perkinsus marinus ATCC 50983]EEQ99187.1 Aldehyde dehydrogenase, putative [Perkinsus marinus ATCC 50983]|eukprot:XP_002766470.1 Aldehyde dehydrogenase, putative [Perkinsus marinus ATCC 50983]
MVTANSFSSETLPIQTKLFINNEYVSAKSGKTLTSINPVDGTPIEKFEVAGPEDIDIAVKAARKAFETWKDSDGSFRRDCLYKLAELIQLHEDRLAELESLDNGKPIVIAKAIDIKLCQKIYKYYAGWADKVLGSVVPVDGSNMSLTVKEPIGVVGQIIPWNFPLVMQSMKLAPALAAGCTVVMKLSEKTPLTGLLFGQLINKAGFPPGVVNIVNGGPDVGPKIIKASAESNLKKVTLELGGKSPMIVCDDADLDQALAAADIGLFINHGQCCCVASRIYVQRGVYDEFVKKAVQRAKNKRVGDPRDRNCDQGPQVDKIQFERVMSYIKSGVEEGAELLCGGKRLGDKGCFIEPTVFGNVKDHMRISREEIFGPVMQIAPFDTMEEVVRRANDTPFGLTAGICTRNIGKATRIAKELKAGTVWVNCYLNLDAAAAFGGYKLSGWGRENGAEGLENYLETKSIMWPVDETII